MKRQILVLIVALCSCGVPLCAQQAAMLSVDVDMQKLSSIVVFSLINDYYTVYNSPKLFGFGLGYEFMFEKYVSMKLTGTAIYDFNIGLFCLFVNGQARIVNTDLFFPVFTDWVFPLFYPYS